MSELYTWPTVINDRWTLRLPAFRAVRHLHEATWEKERLASMWLNIAPSDLIFDVGAESGDLSALFATWVPDGAITLIEPNPAAWPSIKFIFEANALPAPRDVWAGFAAGGLGGEPLPTRDGWPECAYGDIDPACGFAHLAEQADSIPQRTLDSLGAHPNVITIDVEGAELEVLRGASWILHNDRPLVWVSIHPQFMRHHFSQRPADLHTFMEHHDYRAVHLGDDHEEHWLFTPR